MRVIRRLWREQRLVFIAFLVATTLALAFAGRGISRAIFWANPAHLQQVPEAWMTPGYIARSWHLEVEQVDAILGIENGPALVGKGPPTLERIAEVTGEPVVALLARLSAGLPKVAAENPAK